MIIPSNKDVGRKTNLIRPPMKTAINNIFANTFEKGCIFVIEYNWIKIMVFNNVKDIVVAIPPPMIPNLGIRK